MVLHYGVHWLAYLWECKTYQELSKAVRESKKSGASCFELVYHILNKLPPSTTARALKSGGMTHAIMCMFFPKAPDESTPMGDPLGDVEERLKAIKTFKRVLQFIVGLQRQGIKIDLISGPSCFVLGKDYNLPQDELNDRIVRFYKALEDDLKAANVKVAIELLRKEEDFVIVTVENQCVVIDRLKEEMPDVEVGGHYDSFHIDQRGYNQVESIKKLGKRIIHLHLNGTGRLAPGWEGDEIDWEPLIAALTEVGLNNIPAVYEPFCQHVRDCCKELGIGLPDAVPEPEGIVRGRSTLVQKGITYTTVA